MKAQPEMANYCQSYLKILHHSNGGRLVQSTVAALALADEGNLDDIASDNENTEDLDTALGPAINREEKCALKDQELRTTQRNDQKRGNHCSRPQGAGKVA